MALQRALDAPAVAASLPTYAVFAERWLHEYARTNNKESEFRTKRYALKNHLVPTFGALPLDAITVPLIKQFKSGLRARDLSAKTINNKLTILRRSKERCMLVGDVASKIFSGEGRPYREPRANPVAASDAHWLVVRVRTRNAAAASGPDRVARNPHTDHPASDTAASRAAHTQGSQWPSAPHACAPSMNAAQRHHVVAPGTQRWGAAGSTVGCTSGPSGTGTSGNMPESQSGEREKSHGPKVPSSKQTLAPAGAQ